MHRSARLLVGQKIRRDPSMAKDWRGIVLLQHRSPPAQPLRWTRSSHPPTWAAARCSASDNRQASVQCPWGCLWSVRSGRAVQVRAVQSCKQTGVAGGGGEELSTSSNSSDGVRSCLPVTAAATGSGPTPSWRTSRQAGKERSEDVQGDASGTHVLSRLQAAIAAVWFDEHDG